MGLDDLLISTGVDALIKLVRERGKIEIREAAGALGVPAQSVEDWAKVLEGEGLIKIQYQLTQAFLVWTPLAVSERERRVQSVGERKTQTVKKLESLAKNVTEGSVELSALQEQMRTAQSHGQSRLQKLSADLAESDKLKLQIERVLAERQDALAKLREDLTSMRSEMAEFSATLSSLPGQEGQELAVGQMQKLGKAEDELDARLKAARKTFDSVEAEVAAVQTRIAGDRSLEELDELKHTLSDLQFARTEMEKTGANILNESKMMGTELERAQAKLKAIEGRKTEKLNPKKMLEQANQLAKKVKDERENVLKDLEQTLAVVKKQVQAYAQTQYQYQTISGRIESMGSAVDKNASELEGMEKTLSGALKNYQNDLAEAREELETERAEFEEMGRKSKEVEEMLSRLDEIRKTGVALEVKLHGLVKESQIYGLTGQVMEGGRSGRETAGRAGSASKRDVDSPPPRPPGASELPPELAKRIAITTEEEEEFEKKRQELALLVRRMWDEDRKPKSG